MKFNEPPAKLLERLYKEKLGKSYKKVIDGANLFADLFSMGLGVDDAR